MKARTWVALVYLVCGPVCAELEAVYTADYFSVVDGGLQRKGAYLDNFDVSASFNDFLAENGTLYVHLLYNNSNTLSEKIVGDAQVVSNIDNSYMAEIYELWYQWGMGSDSSVVFGLLDLNSTYDVIESAGLFLNSSHGIGVDFAQSGENGPSIFPTTSLALHFEKAIGDNLSLKIGFFDAIPGDPPDRPQRASFELGDGTLSVAEFNYQKNNTTYALGGWYYSRESTTLSGRQENNKGLFVSADTHTRWGRYPGSWWVRTGIADDDINQFDLYVGAGFTLRDMIAGRPDDTFGVAVAHTRQSDAYRSVAAGPGERLASAETTIEMTYQIPVSERLTIQPDLQYVINPGASRDIDDALVVGIRAEFRLL